MATNTDEYEFGECLPSGLGRTSPAPCWTLMISRTAVLEAAGTVGSSAPGLAMNRFGVPFAVAPVGLVRAGRGIAGSRHDRDPQAGVRSGSSLQDEPPLRLADPAFEPLCFPGAGIGWVWCRLGLAEPWSLAVHPRLGAITVLPALLVAFPRIYSLAWFVVALGLAARLVPLFETQGPRLPAIRPGQFPGGRRGRGEVWGHRSGSATGSSKRERTRGPCRRRGRRTSS